VSAKRGVGRRARRKEDHSDGLEPATGDAAAKRQKKNSERIEFISPRGVAPRLAMPHAVHRRELRVRFQAVAQRLPEPSTGRVAIPRAKGGGLEPFFLACRSSKSKQARQRKKKKASIDRETKKKIAPVRSPRARSSLAVPTLAGADLAAEAMQTVGRVRAAIIVGRKGGKVRGWKEELLKG